MVSKRRYNSVERFTSMHLSEFEQRQQLRPVNHSPIAVSEQNHEAEWPMPTSTTLPPGQQQQTAHPFSLMRRRSHELLQMPNASPQKSADFYPQALLTVPSAQNQQQRASSAAPSLASSTTPYSKQCLQYNQRTVQPLPHAGALAHSQFGRSAQQKRIDSQPVTLASSASSSPFHPLQIRPHQSPQDFQSTPQHSFVPRGDAFDRSNFLQKNKIPTPVWATFSVLEVIFGVVSLFVGALNASPYNCMVQPNVPIYLILSGLLLILNGAARIFLALSTTSSKLAKKRHTRQIRSAERKTTARPVLPYAVEGIGLLALLVVVILGSVWIYGASRYMHSQLYMFERHFCEHTLYWFAWWSVTIHLALFALLILLGIVALAYGAMPGRK